MNIILGQKDDGSTVLTFQGDHIIKLIIPDTVNKSVRAVPAMLRKLADEAEFIIRREFL